MTRPTAILHARVSSKGQSEEEVSIPSQLERAREKAGQLGADVLAEFVDDGRSGWTGTRREFEAALTFCEANGVDFFITWSSSRFARNRNAAFQAKQRLDAAGTTLIYLTMPVDRTTDAGFMTDAVLEIFDEMRSREISKDTRRSMISNAQNGYFGGGVTPFGYESAPAPDAPRRRVLRPVPREAATVREIFLRRAEGAGMIQIVQEMNETGRLRRGRRWDKQTMGRLLRNRAVIGQIVFGRKDRRTNRIRPEEEWIVVDSHEPIVDRAVWDRVQKSMQRLGRDAGSPKSSHLFTGLLRCGRCGDSMQVETATGRSGRVYSYYNCRKYLTSRGCPSRRLPTSELDAVLVEAIGERIFTAGNIKRLFEQVARRRETWAQERDEQLRELRAERTHLVDQRERMIDVLADHGRQAPGYHGIMDRMGDLEEAIGALEREIDKLEAKPEPPALEGKVDTARVRARLIELLKTTEDPKRTRIFFQDFIQEVSVGADNFEITYDPARMVRGPAPAVHSSVIWLPERDRLRTRRVVVPMPERWAVAA